MKKLTYILLFICSIVNGQIALKNDSILTKNDSVVKAPDIYRDLIFWVSPKNTPSIEGENVSLLLDRSGNTKGLNSLVDNQPILLNGNIDYDGINDYILIDGYNSKVLYEASYIITFNSNSFSTTPHLISLTSTANTYIRIVSAGFLQIEGNTGGDIIQFAYIFSIDTDYNIAITTDGNGSWDLCVNGVFQETKTLSTSRFIVYLIGGLGVSRQFNGYINEVLIYDRQLSENEIENIYNALK